MYCMGWMTVEGRRADEARAIKADSHLSDWTGDWTTNSVPGDDVPTARRIVDSVHAAGHPLPGERTILVRQYRDGQEPRGSLYWWDNHDSRWEFVREVDRDLMRRRAGPPREWDERVSRTVTFPQPGRGPLEIDARRWRDGGTGPLWGTSRSSPVSGPLGGGPGEWVEDPGFSTRFPPT